LVIQDLSQPGVGFCVFGIGLEQQLELAGGRIEFAGLPKDQTGIEARGFVLRISKQCIAELADRFLVEALSSVQDAQVVVSLHIRWISHDHRPIFLDCVVDVSMGLERKRESKP
jgi:hypothetical protein